MASISEQLASYYLNFDKKNCRKKFLKRPKM